MLDPAQILQKSKQKYPSLLSSIVTGVDFFPITFPIGSLPKEYNDLKDAINKLNDKSKDVLGYGYTVQTEVRTIRAYGKKTLPKLVTIDTEQDYLRLLERTKEVRQFRLDVELIRQSIPELFDWIYNNPQKVIEYSDRWQDLLKVCQYFKEHPYPNLYIRELPIQVHTKFVEQNKGILRELLEIIIPSDLLMSVDDEKDRKFEKRFSLKYPEPMIRLRLIDKDLKAKYNFPATDVSLPVSDFNQLNFDAHPCFITENLMNFLTLPHLQNSIALFGRGYAVESLKAAEWLLSCPIFYWGDMDVDGFKILSQLRSYFPQVRSIMMDIETYQAFQEFAVSIETPITQPPAYLTESEETLYTYLVSHQQRLEQERITQEYANKIISIVTIQ
jgi:hypothetical protein